MSNRLIEVLYQKVEVLESAAGKPTKIRALVSEADRINRNGRVYPKAVWEANLPRMIEDLDQRPGAAYHPQGDALIPDVAILWTNLTLEGNNLYAQGNIIPTRVGMDLDACVRAGVRVGVSSRGYGTTKDGVWNGEPAQIVQSDFECETFDAVIRPSSQDARILTYEELEQVKPFHSDELVEFLRHRTDEEFNQIADLMYEAQWSTAYIDSLPDSSFALVKGKNRALPYKDKDGAVDKAHVDNALARINQAKGFSSEEKAAALVKLKAALKSAGGTPGTNEDMMDEKKAAEALAEVTRKQAEEAETARLVEETKAREAAATALTEATTKLSEAEAKVVELSTELESTKANIDHMGSATQSLADAIHKECDAGNYYNASALSSMAGHVNQMSNVGYGESLTSIGAGIEKLSLGLSTADVKIETLNTEVTTLTEANVTLTASVTDLTEKAAIALKRVGLIEKLVETSKSEKFSWATLTYLLDNVTDEGQIEKKLAEAQKFLKLTLEALGGGSTGNPIVEQKDARGNDDDAAELTRNTMDGIYNRMLPGR